jgi:uncharacterized YccA/Bax inhibitor family protein
MNILETIRNLVYLFPIMLYYFFESLIISIFVSFIWKFFLGEKFGIYLGYFDWVFIIWAIKVILFDVFKLLATFQNVETYIKNNSNNKES